MDNESENSDAVMAAAEAKIIRKRDELLAERALLIQQRDELLIRLRRADRALADCRAAARFFDLKIDFPVDESEQIERIDRNRFQHERALRLAQHEHAVRLAGERESARRALIAHLEEATKTEPELPLKNQSDKVKLAASRGAHAYSSTPLPLQKVDSEPINTTTGRQTLRDVILERLRVAGAEGSKAAPIREFYERTFGKGIHEKTVGMTLYRLQNDGLVRHEGHTWFLAPPKAETGNPGVVAPGPINPQT
jgi:hypothetical protein